MKIIDAQKFINRFKLLTEAVTLPNIRQAILGKKGMKEYPIVDDEKEWYEEHKTEILSTIEKVLNVDDKTLKIKLQKFDTDDFFTNDKPRKLKIKELLRAVRRNFISQVERSRNTEDKTVGIETQYEMMKMRNGVEVYAVYTPMANRYLTHTKLWVQGCYSPTWCIASSTANNYWNRYHLYEAEYPSVFIVAQKTKNGYNKEKYELKCDPYNSSHFKNYEMDLRAWVDEWRNPKQNEEENSFEGTSLFDTFNITPEDLENTMRKLVNSKKAEGFSKKFGKEMLNLYTKKINSGNEDTKMEYLTKACKNGTFINFCDKIDKEDKDYFLDELIRYNTLTEVEVEKMGLTSNKKAMLDLIKNKRCSHFSLEWANDYFGKNMIRKVYHTLPDEILSLDDIDVRETIFENIKNVEGLTEEFLNYQLKNGNVNSTTLDYVKHDKGLFKMCIENMFKNGKVNSNTLYYAKNDKGLFKMILEFLFKNGKVDNTTLYYVRNDKELFKMCIENMIKNNKVDSDTLYYAKNDKGLFKIILELLFKNNKVDSNTLCYVGNDKELFKMILEFLFKNGKVDSNTLHHVGNDKGLLKICVENMIKNNKVDNNTLYCVGNDKGLFKMCIENMIKNRKVNNDTLYHVENDKELLLKCQEYLRGKNRF